MITVIVVYFFDNHFSAVGVVVVVIVVIVVVIVVIVVIVVVVVIVIRWNLLNGWEHCVTICQEFGPMMDVQNLITAFKLLLQNTKLPISGLVRPKLDIANNLLPPPPPPPAAAGNELAL